MYVEDKVMVQHISMLGLLGHQKLYICNMHLTWCVEH
jgi:hypothetical protein